MNKKVLTLILLLFSFLAANAQNNEVDLKEFNLNSFSEENPLIIRDSSVLSQHIIGVKWGYAISKVGFSQDTDHKSIKSPKNYGIYYTYYHSLWKRMPYFGLHTGIGSTEIGYTHVTKNDNAPNTEQEQRYTAIELPFLTQFRVDFWKMRLMLGAGAFASYIISTDMPGGIDKSINRGGYGIMGQGGIAFIFRPFELHFEFDYKYALSHFMDPQVYSTDYWVYTHSNQMQIAVGLYYRLGKRKK